MSNTKHASLPSLVFFALLLIYLVMGVTTDFFFTLTASASDTNNLMDDFGYYERALNDAIEGRDPYSVRNIGTGYLYPPPALFVVEAFHYIEPFYIKFLVYATFNITLMLLIVSRIAKYYNYSGRQVWYWYVFCLGFAPFFETLYMGQINIITLFGICVFFLYLDASPKLSGLGLSLAVITKVAPVIFFGYLIATKRIKNLAAVIAWMIIIGALSILRYGIAPMLAYPKILQLVSSSYQISHNSQSLVAKLAMLFGWSDHAQYQTAQFILMFYIFSIVVASGLFTFIGKQSKEPLFILSAFCMIVSPSIMWYHHYVFLLLPMLIWMGWQRLDLRVISWCLLWLTIIQVDRYLTFGLLSHICAHISILLILISQIRQFYSSQAPQQANHAQENA